MHREDYNRCPTCGKSLATHQSLRRHIARHDKPASKAHGFIKPVHTTCERGDCKNWNWCSHVDPVGGCYQRRASP